MGEIAILTNVLDTIESHFIHGIDAILVDATRFNDTIGRHDNGSGKGGKFKLLILPGCSVVSDQMLEFFEFRVGVSRHHLAVRKHVNARSFCLFEKSMQVLHVMSRNENGLALDGSRTNLSDFGISKRGSMRSVQHAQNFGANFTHP